MTCVVHTHPIHAIAFAATNQPLRAVSHEGAQFTPPDVPRFTQTSDLIVTRELGEAVAKILGGSLPCYLRNHGIVVAATTIAEAVIAAINLERASPGTTARFHLRSIVLFHFRKELLESAEDLFTAGATERMELLLPHGRILVIPLFC